MNAVDTNVLVYSCDVDEPTKRGVALDLLDSLTRESPQAILPWQAAAEFLNCLRRWRRMGKLSSQDVEAYFHDVMEMFTRQLPHAGIFARSMDLTRRFSLSHWDSMLMAACLEAGVDTLYSEDFDAATDYDGLRVVHPFV